MAMTRDEKIFKLAKEITDRAKVLLGLEKVTTDSPEYWGIDSALKFVANKYGRKMSEDVLDLALCMKKRSEVVKTLEELENIWDEYQVYESDEINYIDDSLKMRYAKLGDEDA